MNFLTKRSVALVVIECEMCNPNGSPDDENSPRVLSDNRGWISDVSIKAKIRSILADHESPVFKGLQERFGFDPERFHILESFRRGSNKNGEFTGKDAVAAKNDVAALAKKDPEAFLDKFWDVRVFGTTLLIDNVGNGDGEKKAKKAKKDESSEEEESNKFQLVRTGAVTITPAVSVRPVNITDATITKRACFRDDNLLKLQGDMAPMAKKFVEHGIYVCRICVNPQLAVATRTTEEDIEVLKYLLQYMFSLSGSAARPVGSINVTNLYWADHENILGSFNEGLWWKSLTPSAKPGVEFSHSSEDYEFPTIEGKPGTDLLVG
jgi:CRISPR-associated protein Csd2